MIRSSSAQSSALVVGWSPVLDFGGLPRFFLGFSDDDGGGGATALELGPASGSDPAPPPALAELADSGLGFFGGRPRLRLEAGSSLLSSFSWREHISFHDGCVDDRGHTLGGLPRFFGL